MECVNSVWQCACISGWSTIPYAMWPQTVEYCSIWKPIGEFAFWFLAISNCIVFILGLVLIVVQCRKGLCTRKSDSSARILLTLGPLTLITSTFFIICAFAQLFAQQLEYAIIFDGIASGTFWILAIAYVQTYFQFLAKQTRMNDDLKKRFFSKYTRVLQLYMPLHILCILGCYSVIAVPAQASPLAWDIIRAANISGNFVPLCVIGLYILPSSMHFSIREIEIGAQLRQPSIKPRSSKVDDSNDSYSVKNASKIKSLLFKMKIARIVILLTAASQFVLVLVVNAVPGFRFSGGVQNAISFGCVALLIAVQYLVLLNQLGHSMNGLCCTKGTRAVSTALSPKKSLYDASNEKSVATSGVRPVSASFTQAN
jgi:hypothetical protein